MRLSSSGGLMNVALKATMRASTKAAKRDEKSNSSLLAAEFSAEIHDSKMSSEDCRSESHAPKLMALNRRMDVEIIESVWRTGMSRSTPDKAIEVAERSISWLLTITSWMKLMSWLRKQVLCKSFWLYISNCRAVARSTTACIDRACMNERKV